MSTRPLRVLAVHGIGNHQEDLRWQQDWQVTLKEALGQVGGELADGKIDFVMHDPIFERYPVSFRGSMRALRRLGWSALTFPRRRGPLTRWRDDLVDWTTWYAGMVVNWVENETLRGETRERLIADIGRFQPDVILGHSLGSLICYDTFTSPGSDQLLNGRTFISLGSQIGNPFVVGQFLAGRIEPLRYGRWYHLYNKHDRVFTSPLNLPGDNFLQVETPFRDPSPHAAVGYLRHEDAIDHVWANVAASPAVRAFQADAMRAETTEPREPRQRALLIGIDDYPQENMRLEGCVNDVFHVSSVLQECGFDADEIRVVLNDRATKSGILDRISWLLDGAGPGDRLVLHFSGHGGRLPVYDPTGHVDHKRECLMPHDFAWDPEQAITDEDLFELYGQLDYGVRLVILLDCCHSGGLTRDGSGTIRGVTPPDDIRHRLLRWDVGRQMWVDRHFKPLHQELAGADNGVGYVGLTGDVMRLGAAMPLRTLDNEKFDQVTARMGHHGPYMPTILHACQEDEFAYEYRHGVTSFGAFTFVLRKILRESNRERGMPISFEDLVARAADELADLGYDQTPDLAGPREISRQDVPWGSTQWQSPPGRVRRTRNRRDHRP